MKRRGSLELRFRGTVETRMEATPLLEQPGDAVLIQRGPPRWLLLMCPCGCGEIFPINLDHRAGSAWRLFGSPATGFSVFPSIWMGSGCRSHYIVWRNRILLLGRYDNFMEYPPHVDEFGYLLNAVIQALPTNCFRSYEEIADELGEIPWDVLVVCRRLVREGRVTEGGGEAQGSFARNT